MTKFELIQKSKRITSFFHVQDKRYITFKIKFWNKWLNIDIEESLIIRNMNFYNMTNNNKYIRTELNITKYEKNNPIYKIE